MVLGNTFCQEVFSGYLRSFLKFKFTNVLEGLFSTFIYKGILMNSLFFQNNVSQKVSESELQVAKRVLLAEIIKKASQTDLEALKVSLSKTV